MLTEQASQAVNNPMEEYHVKVNDISRKVGILVNRYQDLKEDFVVLDEENKVLKEQLKAERMKNAVSLQELNLLRLTKMLVPADEKEKTELKRKINEYIKEIDRCVALLND